MDDLGWLALACDLAELCPPSGTAFSVGAVIVGEDGREIARGFSREKDPHDHAEEAALAKAPVRLEGATVYSSLEPCGHRASRPRTCAELIVASGARRVVFAWREPVLFAEGAGAEILAAAGIELVELPDLANRARHPNTHLL
ncbi:deaminase [Actinomadura madurae]|uniref:Diaminohydroxyphosphoribosylaminopyrimidine deaminase n=1 Tax=Actinomadura madurae TaxID=1993 RepID=A0A1I5A3L5_9ACTN|nr:deaminase [Actinomadura madurae]SFN56920.1 diaminohydroxyphosphoribosylaminopyrimidine deaminase [Actinomadura madurae]SPT56924.1 Riboflavin biosynthesis protein RibD [Actinomadura madurae]